MDDDNMTHNPDGTPTESPETQSSAETQSAEEPKLYTQRDLDTRINNMVNGMLTSRLRRFETTIEKRFADAIAQAKGQTAPTPVVDPDQQAAISALEALRAEREAERTAAQGRVRELEERELKSEVETQLAALGATINTRAARALLVDDGRIGRNADGELVFRAEDGNEVPLADGLRRWIGTDEAKAHQPPRGGGEGSGTVVRGRGRPGAAAPSRDEARRDAAAALQRFVLGGGK